MSAVEKKRPLFVVVEGCNGSGKSSIIDRVARQLKTNQGFKVVVRTWQKPQQSLDAAEHAHFYMMQGYELNMQLHKLDCDIVICDRHPFISEPIFNVAAHPEHLINNPYLYQPDILQVVTCAHAVAAERVQNRDGTKRHTVIENRRICDAYEMLRPPISNCTFVRSNTTELSGILTASGELYKAIKGLFWSMY